MSREKGRRSQRSTTKRIAHRTPSIDRRNPDVRDAVERYEEFYALPFDTEESFYKSFLWPEDDTFMVLDRASRTGYWSNKWQEDEEEFEAYTHEHDETPRPLILAVPERGDRGPLVEIPRPPMFAWTFLGYGLDIDANHDSDRRSDREHIDFKDETYLPFLCWWERERALVFLNATRKDYPVLVQGPTLRVGPRGIEG